MASNIGIKIANGEFYPLIEENSSVKKKMILTTAYDNQHSVQIDLFRSSKNVMEDAQYIGSLVVENIRSKPKGEPSIEMVISSNSKGDIIADAVDLDTGTTGDHHVLTVSLKSLNETSREVEIDDFELESGGKKSSGFYNKANKIKHKKKRSFAWLFILLFIIIILGALAYWLFYMGGMDFVNSRIDFEKIKQVIEQYTPGFLKKQGALQQSIPVVIAVEPEPAKKNEPVTLSEPVTISEPVQQVIEPAPVVVEAAPPPPEPNLQTESSRSPPDAAAIPKEGVDYKIKWGDTLWDISNRFYRDPWQYRRIARYNNIINPNHIISGRIIKIPPKN